MTYDRDMNYTKLANQASKLDREMHEALDKLQVVAFDFSSGGYGRFMQVHRQVLWLRNELWYVQQAMLSLDTPA